MSLAPTKSWSCNCSIEVQETDGSSSLVSELQASQRLCLKRRQMAFLRIILDVSSDLLMYTHMSISMHTLHTSKHKGKIWSRW